MKKLVMIAVLAFAVFPAFPQEDEYARFQGVSDTEKKDESTLTFCSAEAVIKYFVDNIREGNIDNALKTYVYSDNNIIEKINTIEYSKLLMVLMSNAPQSLPHQYNSIIKLNLCNYSAGIFEKVTKSGNLS